MDPSAIAFELFGRPIYWYGVLFAGGWLAAVFHWTLLVKNRPWPNTLPSDLSVWLMVGGVLGARIAYILANLSYFMDNPGELIRIDEGGLIYYGGLFGCILAVIIFAKRKDFALWSLGDFVITAAPLGHAFGRFGCHLNGCCYGKESDSFWAVTMQGLQRHPTQLLEVFSNLAIYIALIFLYPRLRDRPGRTVAAYLLLYPPVRFALEFLRGDDRLSTGLLTNAQIISIILFSSGIALWIKTRKPKEQPAT